MRYLLILILALTSSCAMHTPTEPYSESFYETLDRDYTPAPPEQVGFKEESDWTNWNKFWAAGAVGGAVFDLVSTETLGPNCSEANAIMQGGTGSRIVIMTGALGLTYWYTEYVAEDKQTARNWLYGFNALLHTGAGIWNYNLECD